MHSVSATAVSLLTLKSYRRTNKRANAEIYNAWERWWADARGTFNSILEQEGLGKDDKDFPPVQRKLESDADDRAIKSTVSASKLVTGINAPNARYKWRRSRQSKSKKDTQTHPNRDPNKLPRGSVLFNRQPIFLLDATRARRGLLEDVRLWVEVAVGRIFDAIRYCVRSVLFLDKSSSFPPPSPRYKPTLWAAQQWGDMHALTAADAILRAGYPLEEHTVTTQDGYVLQLHRIPRRGARDVVFFQHGVLDTSLGWIVGGTGGSAALAAYDAGFDVWLSNTRANPPRININPHKKGSRYWYYSANELSLCDLPAQIDHIHSIKTSELGLSGFEAGKSGRDFGRTATACFQGSQPFAEGSRQGLNQPEYADSLIDDSLKVDVDTTKGLPVLRRSCSDSMTNGIDLDLGTAEMYSREFNSPSLSNQDPPVPYRLQAVGHSLGAGCLLMYAVGCKLRGQDHRLSRLILLSPAGFHARIPLLVRPMKWLVPPIVALIGLISPQSGLGLRLPSPILRWVTFKLVADIGRAPALLELVKVSLSVATSGDTSEWHSALKVPHYAPASMPAVSLHTANHFSQWARDANFRFYDYGRKGNIARYGTARPPSVSGNYWRLGDLPIDLAAGTSVG